MYSYTVKVKSSDIKQGVRLDSTKCPIARSLRRIFPKRGVSVYGAEAYVKAHNGDTRAFLLPYDARNFIDAFDSGRKVSPLSFVITKEEH